MRRSPDGQEDTWALRYRWQGKPVKLTLAKAYPEMTLAAARAEAEAALETLRGGEDPASKAKEEARPASGCQAVADEWIERDVRPRTRTWPEVRRILDKEVLPAWKRKLITEVGRADVLRLLDSIVDRPAPVLANRVHASLRAWFRWLIERGYVEVSPVAGLRPPGGKEESRDRVLADEELVHVWKSADALGYPFGPYLRFLILTAQRRGEVAGMRWQDVNLEKALWTLPAEQTKPGRIHDVPLSGPALDILKSLPRFEGPHVFSTTGGTRPISGFSKMKLALDGDEEEKKIADWRVHDLRRTAATMMAKSGVAPHVLSAILNHSAGTAQGVTAIYNRFRYVEERRAALEAWGAYLLALAEPKRRKAVAS